MRRSVRLVARSADALVRNEAEGRKSAPSIKSASNIATASPEEPAIANEGIRVPTAGQKKGRPSLP
ncbi:MAG: hypothetical protein WBD22_01235 [Pyrinomonadaceae bacterium]